MTASEIFLSILVFILVIRDICRYVYIGALKDKIRLYGEMLDHEAKYQDKLIRYWSKALDDLHAAQDEIERLKAPKRRSAGTGTNQIASL